MHWYYLQWKLLKKVSVVKLHKEENKEDKKGAVQSTDLSIFIGKTLDSVREEYQPNNFLQNNSKFDLEEK